MNPDMVKSIIIQNCKIRYLDSKTDKDVIFILHGWSHSKELWFKIFMRLTPYYRVIIPDLPGFGDSDRVTGKCSYDTYISILVELINAIIKPGKHRLNIIGQSFGGTLAIKLSQKIKVDTLTLVNTPLLPIWPARLVNKSFLLSKFLYRLILKSTFLIKFSAGYTVYDKRAVSEIMINSAKKADPNTAVEILRMLSKIDFIKELSNITMPLLIIFGVKDRIVLNQYNDKLKNLNIIFYDKCGHTPFLEQEGKFINDLFNFLENVKQKK